MAAADKHWAQAYVNDPLNAPEPFQQDGPGTHFGNSLAANPSKTSSYPSPPVSAGRERPPSKASNNPFRQSLEVKSPSTRMRASSDVSNRLQKTPPTNPRLSGQYRKEAFGGYGGSQRSRSAGHSRNVSNSSTRSDTSSRSRGNSLNQSPLEFARDEAKLAHRSPHLRKHHIPGPDRIDRLDVVGYHHEGPYDAALLARNTSWESSPLAAVANSNAEALKATPRENIIDSVQRHRPLVGTAEIAPGETDRFGRRYDYEEGDNMMIVDGGNYKRWPGVDYLPEDIKGKGEPSFSIDRALKEKKARDKANGVYDGKAETSGIEMQEDAGKRDRSKRASLDGIKRRWGSLRKKNAAEGN